MNKDKAMQMLRAKLYLLKQEANAETGNVDSVLDGAIDLFVNAYLKWKASEAS